MQIPHKKREVGAQTCQKYRKKKAKSCRDYYDYAEIGPMRIPTHTTRLVGNESWSLVKYLRNFVIYFLVKAIAMDVFVLMMVVIIDLIIA